jgi:hypothetical protein
MTMNEEKPMEKPTPRFPYAVSERSLDAISKMVELLGTPDETRVDALIAELNSAEIAEIHSALEHLGKRISLHVLNQKVSAVGKAAAAKVTLGWAAVIGNARKGI